MTSATCVIRNPITFVQTSLTNGYDTSPSTIVYISLLDKSGVESWSLTCIGTDDLLDKDTVNAALTVNDLSKTASFTTTNNTRGGTYIFQSIINDGVDQYGNAKAEYIYNFAVFAIGASGHRLLAVNQTNEGNADFGWIEELNTIVTDVWTDYANNPAPNVTADGIDISGAITLGGGLRIGITRGGFVDYNTEALPRGNSSLDDYGYYLTDSYIGLLSFTARNIYGTVPDPVATPRRFILGADYTSLGTWNTNQFRPYTIINNSPQSLMICKPATFDEGGHLINNSTEYLTLDGYEAIQLYAITDYAWIAEQSI